jgi:hypothetical protein
VASKRWTFGASVASPGDEVQEVETATVAERARTRRDERIMLTF